MAASAEMRGCGITEEHMDAGKLVKRGVIGFVIVFAIALIVIGGVGTANGIEDLWRAVTAWDWKQVAITIALIIAGAIIIK
jgi:hypothetical protein